MNKMKSKMGGVGIILLIQLFLLCTWIGNVVRLCKCDFEAPYKAEAIYALGVFTPTCVVTAFMDLDDGKVELVSPPSVNL